jgi:hypothetical protein
LKTYAILVVEVWGTIHPSTHPPIHPHVPTQRTRLRTPSSSTGVGGILSVGSLVGGGWSSDLPTWFALRGREGPRRIKHLRQHHAGSVGIPLAHLSAMWSPTRGRANVRCCAHGSLRFGFSFFFFFLFSFLFFFAELAAASVWRSTASLCVLEFQRRNHLCAS